MNLTEKIAEIRRLTKEVRDELVPFGLLMTADIKIGDYGEPMREWNAWLRKSEARELFKEFRKELLTEGILKDEPIPEDGSAKAGQ